MHYSSTLSSHNNRGAILPVMLIVLLFLLAIGLTLTGLALSQLHASQRNIETSNSLLAAEAGIEAAIHELNRDDEFAGYEDEQEFFNTDTQGRGTYTVAVEDGDIAEEKIVTATGRVYRHGSDEPASTRHVRVITVGTTTEDKAIRAGAGGLILTGTGGVANGPVHIDGRVDMDGNSSIGSEANPLDVDVAYHACPPGGGDGYPRLCESADDADQPVKIEGDSHIYGNVCATGQSDGSSMSHDGLVENCEAEATGLPGNEYHDRDEQQAAVEETYLPSQASCDGNQDKDWPANLRVTEGSVTTAGSCEITVHGDTWIEGDLDIGSNSTLQIAEGIEERPAIMIDDESGVSISSNDGILPNSDGVGALVITYYSEADCSPDCNDVTGTPLKDSEGIETIHIAGNAEAPATVFYSRWTKLTMAGNATTGGLIGQIIEMSGTGDVVFGEDISSGEKVWSIVNYQRVFEE